MKLKLAVSANAEDHQSLRKRADIMNMSLTLQLR